MSAQQQARGVLMGLLDTPHHFDKRHWKGCQCCKGVTSEVGVFPAAADCPFQGPVRSEGRNIVRSLPCRGRLPISRAGSVRRSFGESVNRRVAPVRRGIATRRHAQPQPQPTEAQHAMSKSGRTIAPSITVWSVRSAQVTGNRGSGRNMDYLDPAAPTCPHLHPHLHTYTHTHTHTHTHTRTHIHTPAHI